VRWGIPDAVLVLAIFPLAVLAGQGYLALGLPFDPDAGQLVYAGLAYGVAALALVVIARRRGLGSLAADFGLAFKPIDLAIGLGISVLGKIVLLVAVAVAALTGALPESGNLEVSLDPLWFVVNGLLIGSLVAPFLEELLFRGLVLRATRYAVLRGPRRAPREQPAPAAVQRRAVVASILVSSALFAALHLYQGVGDQGLFVTLAIGTFAVGLLHAWVTIATGRLGAAIVSHVLFNGSSVLLQLVPLG
jgi:membrane protease YdiL (CAAX protease family)